MEINKFLNFWDAQTAIYCTVMGHLYLDKRQRPRNKNTSAAKLTTWSWSRKLNDLTQWTYAYRKEQVETQRGWHTWPGKSWLLNKDAQSDSEKSWRPFGHQGESAPWFRIIDHISFLFQQSVSHIRFRMPHCGQYRGSNSRPENHRVPWPWSTVLLVYWAVG